MNIEQFLKKQICEKDKKISDLFPRFSNDIMEQLDDVEIVGKPTSGNMDLIVSIKGSLFPEKKGRYNVSYRKNLLVSAKKIVPEKEDIKKDSKKDLKKDLKKDIKKEDAKKSN